MIEFTVSLWPFLLLLALSVAAMCYCAYWIGRRCERRSMNVEIIHAKRNGVLEGRRAAFESRDFMAQKWERVEPDEIDAFNLSNAVMRAQGRAQQGEH